METNKCLNCGTQMTETAVYCSHCGQKKTTGKVSFWVMIKDFFDSVFNLNSKTFSTIFSLFIPGKLTEEYFKGKHKSYANPVRIFVVASLVFMASVFNFDTNNMKSLDFGVTKKITQKEYRIKLDTAIAITQEKINTLEAKTTLDTLSGVWNKKWNHAADSINVGKFLPADDEHQKVALLDIKNLSVQEIMDKYHLTGNNIFEKIVSKQTISFLKNSDSQKSFAGYLLGKMSWLLFALVPVIALLFQLFYIRRKYYFVEHLVFNFHVHSFFFFGISILILLSPILNDIIFTILLIGLLLYLPFAMKRYYKQGWGKTLLKLFLLSITYGIAFLIIAVLFFLISFLLF